MQQAIRSVHARRHKASNATGTGRVSLAQPPLEEEMVLVVRICTGATGLKAIVLNRVFSLLSVSK